MSVVEKLKAFRYTTPDAPGAHAGHRELPWKAVRSVNVAAMKVEEPDLHLMKNLLSLLSEFAITPSSIVHGASDADLLQLIQLMQVSLQFALHSQNVLKGELVERQNLEAVRQVTRRYMEQVEAKATVLAADKAALEAERDTLRLSVDGLRRSLAQQEASAKTLERQLEQERARFYAAVTRQEQLLQLPRGPTDTPLRPPSTKAVDDAACAACGRPLKDEPVAQRPAGGEYTQRRGPDSDKRLREEALATPLSHLGRPAAEWERESTRSADDGGPFDLGRQKGGMWVAPPHEMRRRQRREEKAKFVDWQTFTDFAESVQQRLPQEQQRARQPAVTDSADSVREVVQGTLAELKSDIAEQLRTVQRRVDASTEQLASKMAHLNHQQAKLEAQVAVVVASARPMPLAASSPVTTTGPTAEGAVAGQWERPSHRVPSRAVPLSSQRPSSLRSSPPPDLPRRPQAQESVTPIHQSLPLTPADAAFASAASATASSPAAPSSAAEEQVLPKPAMPPQPQEASLPGVAPTALRSPRDGADPSGRSATHATLTTGVSTSEGRGRQAPPSLHTSSLSVKSRSSLPDFDVSLVLRTPPKAGEAGDQHKRTGSGAVRSTAPEAAQAGPPRSAAGENAAGKGIVRRWYDTPSEEQPASAALRARAAPVAASPTTASEGSLAFDPTSRAGSPVVPTAASTDPEPLGACEHCHQMLPRSQLRAHESGCDLRLIPCASCGRRVVARLMPRHECSTSGSDASKALSRHSSLHATTTPAAGETARDSLEHSRVPSDAGSLGPKRASSVMLMETQRELQQLMEEEEACQRSRKGASTSSNP